MRRTRNYTANPIGCLVVLPRQQLGNDLDLIALCLYCVESLAIC